MFINIMLLPDERKVVNSSSTPIMEYLHPRKNVPDPGGVKLKSIVIYVAYSHLQRFFLGEEVRVRFGKETGKNIENY